MFDSLAKAGKYLGQAAKLMIGMPDYDNYVEHMRVNHPDQTPMTYEEFFRERQDARYGGKGGARLPLLSLAASWQTAFTVPTSSTKTCKYSRTSSVKVFATM